MKSHKYRFSILVIVLSLLSLVTSPLVTRVRAVAEKAAAQVGERNEKRELSANRLDHPVVDLLSPRATFPAFASRTQPGPFAPLAMAGLIFTVNSTADPGSGVCDVAECTLREAITEANAAAGSDTIEFNIPGGGPHTITPVSALPTITTPVIIDGYTQPGASANTLADDDNAVLMIELDGSVATPLGALNLIHITAGTSTVRGLVINRCSRAIGMDTNSGNTIEGNFLGTNVAGNATTSLGNDYGVFISVGSSNNIIGGTTPAARNLISGNNFGVGLLGGPSTVQGNFIGTDRTGATDLGNTIGVSITASNGNTIGGTAAGARNVISGNGNGIRMQANNNVVQGNYIGVNATGGAFTDTNTIGVVVFGSGNTVGGATPAARNIISGHNIGISINAVSTTVQGNFIGTDAAGTTALGNTTCGITMAQSNNSQIGGTAPGAGNLISANGIGIELSPSANGINIQIQGNLIGTDVNGTGDLGNTGDGVSLNDAGPRVGTNILIGGTAAGAGNVISGNNGDGIDLRSVTGVTVQGNLIGTRMDGTSPLGNSGHGIHIVGAAGNTIGGTAPGAGNRIAFNGASLNSGGGIIIDGFGANNTPLRGNSIFGNTSNGTLANRGLGIDLSVSGSGNGPTANDACDGDTGPNNLQNFPIVTSVLTSGGSTTIEGTLDSAAATTFTIDLFSSSSADPSGFGEGETYLGSTTATPSGGCSYTFSFTTPSPVPSNRVVTATATDPSGNTSEFSGTSPVSFVNNAPSFTKGPDQTVNEDAGAQSVPNWATNISPGSPDEAGQTLNFIVTNDNNSLFSAQPAISETGTLTYTPAPNAFGFTPVVVRLHDNGGTANGGQDTSAEQFFIITINAVNDTPSFTKGPDQSVAKDSGAQSVTNWATGISPGPANESGQTLTFLIQNNTNAGLFSAGPAISSTGTLTYTPATGASGNATVTIALMDNGGGADTSPSQTFDISVTDFNDPPDAVNDPLGSVAEDSGMRTIPIASLLSNDSPGPPDESGQTLTFSLVAASEVGRSISSDATNVFFTPTADYFGPASFQYTVTDDGTTNGSPDPKSDTATVSFTITEVNDAPTAVSETIANVAEDSGQRTIPFSTLTTNDSRGPANESGQTLIVKTVSNPVGGVVSILGGDVLFTPTADYFGPASFDYTVEDNGTTNSVAAPLTSGTATASFIITEVNDAPEATDDALGSVAEDSAVRTIPISTLLSNDSAGPSDESGQLMSFSLVAGSGVGGTVSSDATNVYFTPAANFNGAASFQYMVTDNGATNGLPDPKSDTATVSFPITEVNDTPDAVDDALSSVAQNSGMRTIPISSLLSNDSAGPSNESGQTLSFALVAGSGVGGTVTSDATNVYFTPAVDYHGPAGFQYMVTDNGTTNSGADPKSDTATVSFTITEFTDVNDAPTAVGETLANVAEDSAQRTIPFATLTANDSKGPADESGQTLIVKTVSNPVGGTVSILGGNVLFTPAADYNGPASFEYTVEDNGTTNGLADPRTSATATASFSITEVNDAPTALNDPLGNVAEDSGERMIPFANLTSNDLPGPASESGQTLTVKTVSNAVGGTVSIVAGTVRFTPAADFNGQASFLYTVEDNGTTNGAADPKTSGTAIAAFNITEVPDKPSVTNATTNANTQTTWGLVISRNPLDGPEVTHFRVTGITGGSLFKNDGTTPIHDGDFITFAEGNAGLKFTPGTSNGSFTVQASLSNSDAGLASLDGGTVSATILVNELSGVIRFSATDYSVAEGAGFTVITVERTGDTSRAVTVDYASSDHSDPANFIPCTSPGAGFASSRCDFTTATSRLRFAAGETSKTFNVLISQDNFVEGPEKLHLILSNPTGGAVLGVPSTATLELTDDATEPATNPIDNASDFVRQLYHDMLNREPDGPGLAFWTDNIEKCNDPARRPAGQIVAECLDKQRESTAIAFFMSPEFQMTGGFVYRLYKGSLTGAPNYDGATSGLGGRFPTFLEFMFDFSQVSEGIVVNNQISGAMVESNRNRLAEEFVERPEFLAKYGGLNHTLYVQELFNTTGIAATAGEKQALVDGLEHGTETRASVLRKVVDGTGVISETNVQFTTTSGQAFINQEYRRVFVYMEYVGYLRRNTDAAGFIHWLGKLNQFNGDPLQAEMVKSFIMSPEYRSRFGQP